MQSNTRKQLFSSACVAALNAMGIEAPADKTPMAVLRDNHPAKWELLRRRASLEPAPIRFTYSVNGRGEVST